MRLFIAIPLAAAAIEEFKAISARLRSRNDGLRWSAPETWHITLQFLGDTERQQYDCSVARLHELRLPPVPIRFERLGFFDRAGILFAGVGITPQLRHLQQRVIAATELCGFVPETRPYQPHITLARRKERRRSLDELKTRIGGQPDFTSFVAEEFVLFESFLGPTGARHEIRERFPLVGG